MGILEPSAEKLQLSLTTQFPQVRVSVAGKWLISATDTSGFDFCIWRPQRFWVLSSQPQESTHGLQGYFKTTEF